MLEDEERIQPPAGRLDLPLQDPDASKVYKVKVQLGAAHQTHIIRPVEYWDIDRKRYPRYCQ